MNTVSRAGIGLLQTGRREQAVIPVGRAAATPVHEERRGHRLLFLSGGARSGKSAAVQTMVAAYAAQHPQAQVLFYDGLEPSEKSPVPDVPEDQLHLLPANQTEAADLLTWTHMDRLARTATGDAVSPMLLVVENSDLAFNPMLEHQGLLRNTVQSIMSEAHLVNARVIVVAQGVRHVPQVGAWLNFDFSRPMERAMRALAIDEGLLREADAGVVADPLPAGGSGRALLMAHGQPLRMVQFPAPLLGETLRDLKGKTNR